MAITLPFPLLSAMLFLPTLGAVLTYLLGWRPTVAKAIFLAFSLLTLVLAILVVLGFLPLGNPVVGLARDPYTPTTQAPVGRFRGFEEVPWVTFTQTNATTGLAERKPLFFYRLGVDELSLTLVFLTALLIPLAGLIHWGDSLRVREFYAMLLFMETTILGVFTAMDFFLFAIFWELQLVPMYFLIAIWGTGRRMYSALKFFLFTQAASLLVFAGIFVFYYYQARTDISQAFNMMVFTTRTPIPPGLVQDALFAALLFGFGTKLPMVPVHTWLPDAHVDAPTGGSVILAGVLLKMGGYGLIRVNVQMLPQGAIDLFWLAVGLGVIGMIYGAFVSLAQDDLKRLVANSSISHMGFVLLGIGAGVYAFRHNPNPAAVGGALAMSGAIFEMFAHGLISAALFMVAGSVGHILGTRSISKMKGMITPLPLWAGFTMIAFMASLGLPGLVGFAAEFLVFAGTYEAFGLWVLVPIVTVVLTAAYYIYAMQRALFGPYDGAFGHPHDLHRFEAGPLAVLAALFAFFGILPFLFLQLITGWWTGAFPLPGVR